jgi:hypothetical protein
MPRPNRKAQLLERVWHAVGANRIEVRWIAPAPTTRRCEEVSIEGLACGSTIIVSPIILTRTLIHEALHRANPGWDEGTIEKHTTYLYTRLSDEEARRLYTAMANKAVYIDRPIPCPD